MPTNLFMAYVDQMPRIRAERLLDAAQAAGVSQMSPEAAGDWYDRTEAEARGGGQEPAPAAATPKSAFRLNGVVISAGALGQALAGVSGSGFAVEAAA